MVNVKVGTALLTGSSLLKQKERADELFVEEVRFLRSCFLESPEKAKQLTQLRIAKLVKPSILENYEMIRDVEPDIRYQSVPFLLLLHCSQSPTCSLCVAPIAFKTSPPTGSICTPKTPPFPR